MPEDRILPVMVERFEQPGWMRMLTTVVNYVDLTNLADPISTANWPEQTVLQLKNALDRKKAEFQPATASSDYLSSVLELLSPDFNADHIVSGPIVMVHSNF